MAYGKDACHEHQGFRWFKAFSDGREPVADHPLTGRPLTSKIDDTTMLNQKPGAT